MRTRSSAFYVGGDIIVAVNGVKTASVADLYVALETTKPGDTVTVDYWRGGKKLSAQIVLSDRARAGVND